MDEKDNLAKGLEERCTELEKQMEYYKGIAEKTGQKRLREVEQLNRLLYEKAASKATSAEPPPRWAIGTGQLSCLQFRSGPIARRGGGGIIPFGSASTTLYLLCPAGHARLYESLTNMLELKDFFFRCGRWLLPCRLYWKKIKFGLIFITLTPLHILLKPLPAQFHSSGTVVFIGKAMIPASENFQFFRLGKVFVVCVGMPERNQFVILPV